MRQAISAAIILLTGAGSALAGDAGILPWRDAAVVTQGQQVYGDYCAACHGEQLQGEPDWQSRDADGFLPAPPHDFSGHTWHHPDQQLFEITKYGIEAIVGGTYKSRMGAYDGILSDAEIIAVLAYIKSTWPERIIDIHDKINADASPD